MEPDGSGSQYTFKTGIPFSNLRVWGRTGSGVTINLIYQNAGEVELAQQSMSSMQWFTSTVTNDVLLGVDMKNASGVKTAANYL